MLNTEAQAGLHVVGLLHKDLESLPPDPSPSACGARFVLGARDYKEK